MTEIEYTMRTNLTGSTVQYIGWEQFGMGEN